MHNRSRLQCIVYSTFLLPLKQCVETVAQEAVQIPLQPTVTMRVIVWEDNSGALHGLILNMDGLHPALRVMALSIEVVKIDTENQQADIPMKDLRMN